MSSFKEFPDKFIELLEQLEPLIESLCSQGSTTLHAAIDTFNQQFNKMSLTPTHLDFKASSVHRFASVLSAPMHQPAPIRIAFSNHIPVDEALEAEIRVYFAAKEKADTPISTHNMLLLIREVYHAMNSQRALHRLTYHSARHAYEMFTDSTRLLAADPRPHINHCTLLVGLCALFHDVVFTHNRLIDEVKSFQGLRTALHPILCHLKPQQQEIIENLLFIFIMGGTLPVMLNNSDEGTNKPLLINCFEVLDDYLRAKQSKTTRHPVYQLLYYCSQTLASADLHRASIPQLYQSYPRFIGPHWELLRPLFASLAPDSAYSAQRLLGQCLRTLSEMPDPIDKTRPRFKDYVALCQGKALEEMLFDEAEITSFAGLIDNSSPYAELKFIERMHHACERLSLPKYTEPDFKKGFELHSKWLVHQRVMAHIHVQLTDPSIDITLKSQLMGALIHAASDQDGQNPTLKTLLSHCETVIRPTLNSVPTVSAGAGCY